MYANCLPAAWKTMLLTPLAGMISLLLVLDGDYRAVRHQFGCARHYHGSHEPDSNFAPMSVASATIRSAACLRDSAMSRVYSAFSPPTMLRKSAIMSHPTCRDRMMLPYTRPSRQRFACLGRLPLSPVSSRLSPLPLRTFRANATPTTRCGKVFSASPMPSHGGDAAKTHAPWPGPE